MRKQTQILTEAYKGMEERRESRDQEILELKEKLSEVSVQRRQEIEVMGTQLLSMQKQITTLNAEQKN